MGMTLCFSCGEGTTFEELRSALQALQTVHAVHPRIRLACGRFASGMWTTVGEGRIPDETAAINHSGDFRNESGCITIGVHTHKTNGLLPYG